jgi:CRISPR/Cas system-associated endonuclease/helicase Cas3
MKAKNLEVGHVYKVHLSYSLATDDEYFIMLLLRKTSDELIFATYNSSDNTWYIPDTWNYDFESDKFQEYRPRMLTDSDRRGIIESLFREVK